MKNQPKKMVYFVKPIGMDGPIKIGCSEMPYDRLKAQMAWSPFPLEILVTIPGDIPLESNIHDCFADSHSHSEWFYFTERLWRAIEHLKAGYSVEKAIDLNDKRGSVRGKRQGPWPEGRRRFMSACMQVYQAQRRGANSLGFINPHAIKPSDWVGDLVQTTKARPLKDDENEQLSKFIRNPAEYSTIRENIARGERPDLFAESKPVEAAE